MASKFALARRIVSDFHGEKSAEDAEDEWRRVHQARQAPQDMPLLRLSAGAHRAADVLVAAGLAPSKSEAVRLVRATAPSSSTDARLARAESLEIVCGQGAGAVGWRSAVTCASTAEV